MNDVVALALILLLASSGYAAGRVHGQFGYRWGYRHGYRQGYFDGDRASWIRRRRDLQAAVASVINATQEPGLGTTYTSAARADTDLEDADAPEDDAESVDEAADVPQQPAVPMARGVVAPWGRHAKMERDAGRPFAQVASE